MFKEKTIYARIFPAWSGRKWMHALIHVCVYGRSAERQLCSSLRPIEIAYINAQQRHKYMTGACRFGVPAKVIVNFSSQFKSIILYVYNCFYMITKLL